MDKKYLKIGGIAIGVLVLMGIIVAAILLGGNSDKKDDDTIVNSEAIADGESLEGSTQITSDATVSQSDIPEESTAAPDSGEENNASLPGDLSENDVSSIPETGDISTNHGDSSEETESSEQEDDSTKSDNSSKPEDDSTKSENSSKPENSSAAPNTGTGSNEIVSSTDSMFTDKDLSGTYNSAEAVNIKLNGTSIAVNSNKVTVSGTTVTIKSKGTYIISGTLNNGMIVVNAPVTDKVYLVLNGATVSKSNSAPLYIKQADKVFITLPVGKVNTLSSGSSFVAIDANNIDATIFSKEDLTINGKGTLTVNSPAGHGIVSKDDLIIAGGNYNITSSAHAFCGKNSLRIAAGTFNIDAGKDGFHSENIDNANSSFLYASNVGGVINAYITCSGDAISGQSALTIKGGYYEVKAAGGSGTTIAATLSAKGLKSAGTLTVSGGTFKLNTADDGIHSNGNVVIAGGDFTVDCANDGVQAGGTLAVSGGKFNIKCAGGWNGSISTTESAKGLSAAGEMTIGNGTMIIDSADDAVHSNTNLNINGGSFTISTGDDGFHANNLLTINGGSITINRSYEGLEGLGVVLNGGTIILTASDDGINAAGGADSSGIGGTRPGRPGDSFSAGNGYIKINGGTCTVNASGDGIDANGSITITGGTVYVSGPTNNGNGSLDYDGSASISGGMLICAGSSGMTQNFGTATNQGCVMYNVNSQAANSTITLKDSSGKILLTWTAPKAYASVIISCPDLTLGNTYTLTAGSYSTTFTLSTLLIGSGGGMGGPRPGRP